MEYTIKNNLKFLGPPSNPLYYLMGTTDDFNEDTLIIPEGTSIKELILPEGKLAYDETLIAFDSEDGTPLSLGFVQFLITS